MDTGNCAIEYREVLILKNIVKYGALIFLGLGCLMGHGLGKVQATVDQQRADFEVEPILPDQQVDDSLNYFDLKCAPGSDQRIKIRIQNFTDHAITVHAQLRNAFTQAGGGIDFTPKTNLDKSLKIPFTKIAQLKKGEDVIHLAPQATTVLETNIKLPQNKYRGLIYGSWHFIEYLHASGNGASAISSNYSYSVGVALRGAHYKVYPELKYSSVKPLLYNKHPAIGIHLRNIESMAISKVAIDAAIVKKGIFSSKYTYKTTNTNVAPNSQLTLPISWAYDKLSPGTYTARVKVTGENYWNKLPMTWHFNKTFTVKDRDAAVINQQAIKKPINKWALVATTSGLVMLISVIAYLKLLKIGAA